MEELSQYFEQLRRLLVKLGYPNPIDKEKILIGKTTELLPLLHFGLLSHSEILSKFLLNSGFDLYKKNDLRFTQGIYKLLRKEFKYNPVLQCSQFLTDKGFAKRKIEFVVKVLNLGIKKHNQLIKREKLDNAKKVSWKNTDMFKKIKQTNDEQKQKQTQKTKKSLKILKTKQKKTRIKSQNNSNNNSIHNSPPMASAISHNNTVPKHHKKNNIMNESTDEIRCDFPEPIAQQIPMDLNEQKEVDLEYHESEEKAMELSMDKSHENMQSIQIPTTITLDDMSLIPEYDPNKMYERGDIDNINNNDDESDDDDNPKINVKIIAHDRDTHALNEEGNMKRNDGNSNMNTSYLDSYSTLMDIPSAFLDPDSPMSGGGGGGATSEMKDREEHAIQHISFHNADDDNGDVNNESDDDDSDQDDDMDDIDDDDDDGGGHGGHDIVDVSEHSRQKRVDDEDSGHMNGQMALILSRLDAMDTKMSHQFENISARMTILEGKMRFVEDKMNESPRKSKSNESSSRHSRVSSTVGTSSSSTTQSSKSKSKSGESKQNYEKQRQPPIVSKYALYGNESEEVNNGTFVESTIGSASMPLSLTPYTGNTNNNSNINSNIHSNISSGGGVGAVDYGSRMAMMGNTNNANNINVASVMSGHGMNNNNNNMNMERNRNMNVNDRIASSTTSALYSSSVPQMEVMKYPVSSSSDRKTGDDDSTANFINELKEMLRNTDQLLQSKPISMYSSQFN